jgi:hypothetical protein
MSEDTAVLYRLNTLEHNVSALKQQLDLYVPMRENELQLSNIRDTVGRIERDVQEAKKSIEQMDQQWSALQIRVLWGVVSTIIAILTAVLIGYVTHFFK